MSDMKNIIKLGLVAAAIYGAYKLGQMSKETENEKSDPKYLSELDEVEIAIGGLEKKPYKTQKDRDILDLLKIKLKQLTK
jgi:hypothetical protein